MTAVVILYSRAVSQDPALADLLDPHERERSARRGSPARYVTAHALLRTAVAGRTGQAPREIVFERHCATCGSALHGKPVVRDHPDVHVSLSYAGRLAVVAVSDSGETGVDVEQVEDADHEGFDQATLAPDEHAAFEAVAAYHLGVARAQVWARKEAVLKATGHGLVVAPREVVVSGPDEDAALLEWRGDLPIDSPVHLLEVPLGPQGYAAAVAILCDRPVRLDLVEP